MADIAEVSKVTLWRHPIKTMWTFLLVIRKAVISLANYIAKHATVSSAVALFIGSFMLFMQSPPAGALTARNMIAEHGSFILYWVVLGVLSSIGLGSGLHTFVLFLGPHIVRVANTAVRHGHTGFSAHIASYFKMPSEWSAKGLTESVSPTYAADAWELHADGSGAADVASFMSIVIKVAWPCFLWGLGTSIGELPPYFIARAARRAGEALEELAEVTELELEVEAEAAAKGKRGKSKGPSKVAVAAAAPVHHPSLVERAKVWVFESVQRYGFWAVLAAASIPNPLFDLAGLTCGHFGIPFATFAGATFIGKAIIKVSIQSWFIIAAVYLGPSMVTALQASLPEGALKAALTKATADWLAGQYEMCHKEPDCASCCKHNFRQWGAEPCIASCAAATAGADAAAAGGLGAFLKSAFDLLWGWFLLGMIGFFLVSIVHSLVHEYLVKDATEAAEAAAGAGKAGGATAQVAVGSAVKATATPGRARASSAAAAGAPAAEAPAGPVASTKSGAAPATATKGKGKGKGKGKAAAAVSPVQVAAMHAGHIHGADVLSALVHAGDLLPSTSAAAATEAPAKGKGMGAAAKGAAAQAKARRNSVPRALTGLMSDLEPSMLSPAKSSRRNSVASAAASDSEGEGEGEEEAVAAPAAKRSSSKAKAEAKPAAAAAKKGKAAASKGRGKR